jgi:hypothetical protein
MMKPKVKCSLCKKIINGVVKIVAYRKKVGNSSKSIVEFYDTECFKLKNKERSVNERNSKKRNNKARNRK